jgi:hypothetical protein
MVVYKIPGFRWGPGSSVLGPCNNRALAFFSYPQKPHGVGIYQRLYRTSTWLAVGDERGQESLPSPKATSGGAASPLLPREAEHVCVAGFAANLLVTREARAAWDG